MGPVLRFRLRDVPVAVEPGFWLVTLLLAPDLFTAPQRLPLWIAVVFASVLLHEMGHALVLRRFRHRPSITLTMMGGQAQAAGSGLTALADIYVSLAGPFAGLAVGVPLLIVLSVAPALRDLPVLGVVLTDLVMVNVGWGLLNLLPVMPLDGGQVLLAALHKANVRDATRRAHQVSIAVAVVGSLFALALGAHELALMGGVLAFYGGRALRRA
jgi:Zn-dependent protease